MRYVIWGPKTRSGLHANMCPGSLTFFITTILDSNTQEKKFTFHTLVTLILGRWIAIATLRFTQCIRKYSSTGVPSVCLVLSHTLLPFSS